MRLFDAHCQLQFPDYDADREAVLARMREAGMGAVVVGTDHAMSQAAVELAREHDFLWATVGAHPNEEEAFDPARYEKIARDPKVVAIGECGLDYFRSKPEGQREKFELQIMLAQKLGKPLMVHCRDAHDDMLALLRERRPSVPVVMHFFTGSGELAQRYLELGCYLSFPGPVTYTDRYDDSLGVCPAERLLVETDAPFAAPVPYRGKRNEPAYVRHVLEKAALVKGVRSEELAAQIVANARNLFGM